MSTTNFGTNDALALKLWAKKAFNDSVKETLFGKMIGTSDRSIIQVKDETSKSVGDRIRFSLRSLPSGTGVQDDETLEGNEEGLSFTYFDLNLGEKRHAIKVDLNISEQRTLFEVRNEAKDALVEWSADYMDTTVFEYMSGIGQGPVGSPLAPIGTYGSRYHTSGPLGGNALDAFSADRQVFGGAATSINTLTAGMGMTLSVVDKLVERAKLASPTMRKANFDGRNLWVLVLHPWQVSAIRSNTTTGQWLDIQKALTQGGGKGLLFEEALGVYRDVLMVESTRIPTFVNGSSVSCARALFLGAQAGVTAYGRKTKDSGKLDMVERSFDYGKRLGQSCGYIWGLRRTKFLGQSDFSSFAVDTAAAAL